MKTNIGILHLTYLKTMNQTLPKPAHNLGAMRLVQHYTHFSSASPSPPINSSSFICPPSRQGTQESQGATCRPPCLRSVETLEHMPSSLHRALIPATGGIDCRGALALGDRYRHHQLDSLHSGPPRPRRHTSEKERLISSSHVHKGQLPGLGTLSLLLS